MCRTEQRDARIRSAIHVDFDNSYLSMAQSHPAAAEEFARRPDRWLRRLLTFLDGSSPADFQRDLLVKRCYMNPGPFGRYRLHWVRAGFEVIDCPVLTGYGKTAADMTMAAEILEEVHHATRFDEFILLSADADFTPIFLKLRLHDRRTVAVVAQKVATSYAAVCDRVVGPAEFLSVIDPDLSARTNADAAA